MGSARPWAMFLAAACLGALCPQAAEPSAAKDKIAELVKKLGADDFDARLDAQEQLKAVGEPARAALDAASRSSDPEVAGAAGNLLKRLNLVTIFAKVVDGQDKPIPDVRVMGYIARPEDQMRGIQRQLSETTGADGCALFKDFEPGVYNLALHCQLQGYQPTCVSQQNHTVQGRKQEFKLVCRRLGSVKGVLLGKDTNPLPEQQVNILHSQMLPHLKQNRVALPQLLRGQLCCQTDKDGAFEIKGIHPAQYVVIVMQNEKLVYQGQQFEVVLEKDLDLGKLTLDIVVAKDNSPPAKEQPKVKP